MGKKSDMREEHSWLSIGIGRKAPKVFRHLEKRVIAYCNDIKCIEKKKEKNEKAKIQGAGGVQSGG